MTEEMEVEGSFDSVKAKLKQISHDLNWIVVKEDNTSIIFKTPVSRLSWGETVVVKLTSSTGNMIKVSMKSNPDAQLFDWGRSADNLRKVKENLQRQHG